MDKISSSHELQVELQRLINLAQTPHPSRMHLASELRALAERLAAKVEWTEKGGQWMASARYAGGKRDDWAIRKVGEKFDVHVRTDDGAFKHKKPFDSLDQAQRFGARFIDKANGHEMLDDILSKDFTKG